jgi:hypothetical protein
MVLTDIPYNEVSRKSAGLRRLDKGAADVATLSTKDIVALLATLAPTHYVFCGIEQVSSLRANFVKAGFTTRLGIWEKTNPSPMNGQYLWLSSLECCVFARKKGAVFNLHCAHPVWKGSAGRRTFHPTQKPTWLFRLLIEASSRPNDVVLDPFCGSGTSLVAAIQTGRKSIGVELDKGFCDGATARLQKNPLI